MCFSRETANWSRLRYRFLSVLGMFHQVESCPATEARLVQEFRKNPYARSVLLVTMARLRSDRTEQEALLMEAMSLLRQAEIFVSSYAKELSRSTGMIEGGSSITHRL